MREIRWKVYAAVAAMAIGAFLVVPNSGWTRVAVLVAIGYAAVAAVLVGLRRNDPTGRAVWLCFAAGVFSNASGILVEQVDTELLAGDGSPAPTGPCTRPSTPAATVSGWPAAPTARRS